MKLHLAEGTEAHFLQFDKIVRELNSIGATLEEN